jgi:hypothetical protein
VKVVSNPASKLAGSVAIKLGVVHQSKGFMTPGIVFGSVKFEYVPPKMAVNAEFIHVMLAGPVIFLITTVFAEIEAGVPSV